MASMKYSYKYKVLQHDGAFRLLQMADFRFGVMENKEVICVSMDKSFIIAKYESCVRDQKLKTRNKSNIKINLKKLGKMK